MNKYDLNSDKIDEIISKLKFNNKGLIPAVLQDVDTGEVLMMAYMNENSLRKTFKTGKACFWSRSRQELWLKGETSGNYQEVEEIRMDCDNDTLLLKVKPEGPACHTGNRSCFYRNIKEEKIEREKNNEGELDKENIKFLYRLYSIINSRKKNLPENSYSAYLFREGFDKIGKKIGEEAAEVIIAGKNQDKDEIIYESADLIYHLLVVLVLYNISIEEVIRELESRHSPADPG